MSETGGLRDWQPSFGAATSLVGDIWSNIAYKRRERSRRKYDIAREEDRRQYDRSRWEDQLAYNHPTQQIQRLIEAGLNPNLIYGSSPGSAVGNAGAVHPGGAPKGDIPRFQLNNPIIPFMDTKVKQAQSDNLNSAAAWNDAKAVTEAEKADLTGTQARLAKDSYSWNMELKKAEAQNAYQNLLQNRIRTEAFSKKDTGFISRYATETMTAKIEQDLKEYQKHRAALSSFLAKKGIYEDSPVWLKLFGNMFPKTWDMTWDPQSLIDHRMQYEKTYKE